MPDPSHHAQFPDLALILAAAGAALGCALMAHPVQAADRAATLPVLTSEAAYGDWTTDAPGVRRRITPADLPPPYATNSASNGGRIVRRPAGASPQVPPGFKVEEFATGLGEARLLRTAPNGDIFIADIGGGNIWVLRTGGSGQRATVSSYAKGLNEPFGLAFYPPGSDPQYLYVGTVDKVVRFAYRNGDAAARGKAETIVPHIPDGGHATRDVIFSPDGRKMYVSVGSLSNDEESGPEAEARRANILEFNPDGSGERRFATGLRNPVQMALHPLSGELWTVVNERDGLGDNLPPDYATRVRDGAFYGWPWYYIGPNQDPRYKGAYPELRDKVAVPDVLIQPHSAPLGLAIYTGKQFPAAYRNDLFVALHGSWNRSRRTGYKVVRVPLRNGKPTGEYEDFLTGFVTPEGDVWARPVGVGVASDGSLLVSEDAGGTVWRISYAGAR
ncbi:MAG TPA: sorbosone dehydrogenase family protein [Stellaceae bacterium]